MPLKLTKVSSSILIKYAINRLILQDITWNSNPNRPSKVKQSIKNNHNDNTFTYKACPTRIDETIPSDEKQIETLIKHHFNINRILSRPGNRHNHHIKNLPSSTETRSSLLSDFSLRDHMKLFFLFEDKFSKLFVNISKLWIWPLVFFEKYGNSFFNFFYKFWSVTQIYLQIVKI